LTLLAFACVVVPTAAASPLLCFEYIDCAPGPEQGACEAAFEPYNHDLGGRCVVPP
jgi:hypothetical protein